MFSGFKTANYSNALLAKQRTGRQLSASGISDKVELSYTPDHGSDINSFNPPADAFYCDFVTDYWGFILPGEHWLTGIHSPQLCEGRPCVVHRPTDHHMSTWRLLWRSDKGIFERLCPQCGSGIADPDQYEYLKSIGQEALMIGAKPIDCIC